MLQVYNIMRNVASNMFLNFKFCLFFKIFMYLEKCKRKIQFLSNFNYLLFVFQIFEKIQNINIAIRAYLNYGKYYKKSFKLNSKLRQTLFDIIFRKLFFVLVSAFKIYIFLLLLFFAFLFSEFKF